ncbi:MAG: heme-binding domain-containing protein [Gemmatimonadota bacterium]
MTMKILAAVALVLVGLQLVPVDRSAPADQGPLVIGDPVVAELVDRACADCHTNETTWPWYSRVAPLSWWVADHVHEGREELNLSRWGAMDAERKDHKLEEFIEMVEEGEMPLPSYTWGHPEARLTSPERQTLVAWARSMRQGLGVADGDQEEPGDGAAGGSGP